MVLDILSKSDVLRGAYNAIQMQHDEAQYSIYAEVPAAADIQSGDAVGFKDIDGRYRIFEITDRTLREPDGIWELNGIDKAVRELMDEPITEYRARGVTVAIYVSRLLQGTRYQLGVIGSTNTGTMTSYYEPVWSALAKVQEAFDVKIVPYYQFANGRISGRVVDIVANTTAYRGRLFELGDDLTGISVSYDESSIKTALYGRGQGVQIDGGGDDDPSYGRRLTFADVAWTKSAGKPADKPAGQEWIGDPDALTQYGRGGRHRFGYVVFEDITDPEELLQATWNELQDVKAPRITVEATMQDTERIMGRTHEAVRLMDTVLVRLARLVDTRRVTTDISAKVVGIIRDYVYPELTRLTIGNTAIRTTDILAGMSAVVSDYQSKSAIWDRANAFDINGVMDVLNNQIISTTGGWYTDPDTGAIMLVSSDGKLAMRLTGAGWQIASGKVGGAWIWRTAATGSGIVADAITAGVLQAALVKILGDDKFYWDANNICIINPDNNLQQIRIGKYDGVHYGVGFTKDGGKTWEQSMDFNGVIAQSIGTLTLDAKQIASGTLSADRIGANSIAVSKLTGTISATATGGTAAWSIDLTSGTLTIGDINAGSIKAGTLSADRIGANSIAVSKLTGTISATATGGTAAWSIDLTSGTLTIGDINAGSIKAGTLSADLITAGSLNLNKLATSTVFTNISDTGIKITHRSSLGGYTWLNNNGLSIYNSNNQQIGGIMTLPDGTVGAAMQTLYNPAVSTLSVQVGSDIYASEEDGLLFKLGSADCFGLTGASNTFRLFTFGASNAFVYGSGGSINIQGQTYAEIVGPYNAKIAITSTGDIQCSWMHNGRLVTYNMWDILNGNVD